MAGTRALVPVQKRIIAWVSAAVLGLALYLAFVSILTAAPAREREKVRGHVAALVARALATPREVPAGDLKASMAETRTWASLLGALQKREAELSQACRAKRFWATLIGLVAGGGCFALCSVYWILSMN